MLIHRAYNYRGLLNVVNRRLLATQVDKQSENVGPVVFERLTGVDRGIAIYGLNSPKDRNALGFGLIEAMKEVNRIIKEDTKLSVVILHSMVPGIFCAGEIVTLTANHKDNFTLITCNSSVILLHWSTNISKASLFYNYTHTPDMRVTYIDKFAGANLKERFKMNDDEVAKFVKGLRATFIEVEDLPMPTIAAVDGVAVGGGLELALACDIRVVSETAKLGLVETGRGLIPGAGGTQRLPRSIHIPIAKELIFTSRIVGGKEAKELGIANHVVPQSTNNNAAYEKALTIAREIIQNAPIALRCAKQAINQGVQLNITEGYQIEQKFYEVNIPTKDRQEGMISFMEKRKPIYEGQ